MRLSINQWLKFVRKMSKIKELLGLAEISEFKTVLENWDSSILSNEAENEMGKVLKGQQPKAFLNWLLTLKDKEIPQKKIKLKKDIIRESVKLLEEILVEENDSDHSNNPTDAQHPATSLQCSVCKTSVLQESSKDIEGKDIDAMMQALDQLKMHWICVDCKQRLDNNKSVGKDALQYLENQTKSLQLNTGSEESDSTEIETILEDKERTNTAEIERTKIETQTEIETQTVRASVEAQTEEIQTTNMHTQTIAEETTQTIPEETTQTIPEETTTKTEQTTTTEETTSEKTPTKDVQKTRKSVETKNNSTQTLEKEQISLGEKQIEDEYRKQIAQEVQVAHDLKKSKEKQKTSKLSSSKQQKEKELEKHEMEQTNIELDKYNLFMEKYKTDERLLSKNTLYSVLVAEIEKKSLKRYGEPSKKDVYEEPKKNRYPKSSFKHPETDTEKEVSHIRNRLEHIIDKGGDWR